MNYRTVSQVGSGFPRQKHMEVFLGRDRNLPNVCGKSVLLSNFRRIDSSPTQMTGRQPLRGSLFPQYGSCGPEILFKLRLNEVEKFGKDGKRRSRWSIGS